MYISCKNIKKNYFTCLEVPLTLVRILHLNSYCLYFLDDQYSVANVLLNMDFVKFLLRMVNPPRSA